MTIPKTLIISRGDAAKLVEIRDVIVAVEDAFREYGRGRARMPAKIYLDLAEYGGDFRAMPAYVAKMKLCTLKWVNAHPGNARFGLPAVMAVVIVSDPKTGLPLAIMDGTLPTALRTGAGGAVAAKYLARKNASIIGLVGCGVQGRMQLKGLREILKVREVRVWGDRTDIIRSFVRDMKRPGETMISVSSVRECVEGCDLVVTTTPSRKPLVRSEWIAAGTHINAIGADAPGKEELDPKLLQRAKIVVDDWGQASHSGEINVPVRRGLLKKKDIYATLGDVVAAKKKGRTNSQEITVFDSTGLAIQDTAVAGLIYRRALRRKAGRWIEII